MWLKETLMPAMPSLQSLMFKKEEPIIGFWPGCQTPDLKEVARFFFLPLSLGLG